MAKSKAAANDDSGEFEQESVKYKALVPFRSELLGEIHQVGDSVDHLDEELLIKLEKQGAVKKVDA